MSHFSYSQIKTYILCPRKWAFLRIDGQESHPSVYAQYGEETHLHLERWFKHKKLPPETGPGLTARAILTHLPPPQTPGIEVEQEITFYVGRHKFLGFIDLLIPIWNPPFIADHKTTGDFCWAISEDNMASDIQVVLYSYAIMCLCDVTKVICQWTYGLRGKQAQGLKVRKLITYDDIVHKLIEIEATADEMQKLIDSGCSALETPYYASGCEAFGGCQFVDVCNLSPQERFRSIMAQAAVAQSFKDKLAARRAEQMAARGGGINPPEEAPKIPVAEAVLPVEPAPELAPEPEPDVKVLDTDSEPPQVKTPKKPIVKPASATKAASPPPKVATQPLSIEGQPIPFSAASGEVLFNLDTMRVLLDMVTDAYRKGFQDGQKSR